MKQIFTNADKIHAAKVLTRLGLEDCFEGIICFETLNPTKDSSLPESKSDVEGLRLAASTSIFNILEHFSQHNDDSDLPKTPVLCKPSVAGIKQALEVANINPQRTVR